MSKNPSICLNMIVRNEAHIVREVLDCVAPYIDFWVIVDTGSDDGTQDVIRNHMAELGIPGEVHERPWRNFGANRSEALDLAQGHSDYIWVMDADDLLVGTIDLSDLTADAYYLRIGSGFTYWRQQLLKDGLPWSYRGVVHEYLHCDGRHPNMVRLHGDYHVVSRRMGNRSSDPEKYARDRDLLLAELERNPDDERSVFYLAQSYLDYGDPASALKWYQRRVEMGRWHEEVYYSLFRVAECMAKLGEPWPMVLDAYLKAWAFRPVRAEPLAAIAHHYLFEREWQLGYLFAKRAAEIPHPDDLLFVNAEVYTTSALDTQSVCASWLGKHHEAFSICRGLLASDTLAERHRGRIAANRDFSIPSLVKVAEDYRKEAIDSLVSDPLSADVTATFGAGPERAVIERAVNSFVNCCSDTGRIGRFVIIDNGLSDQDRSELLDLYPFLDFHTSTEAEIPAIRNAVRSRYWLHVPYGWQFFFAEDLVGRLTAVLEAEPDVSHVAINLDDVTESKGSFAEPSSVRRAGDKSRYVLTEKSIAGPAMYDTTRLGGGDMTQSPAATLDEVLALKKA